MIASILTGIGFLLLFLGVVWLASTVQAWAWLTAFKTLLRNEFKTIKKDGTNEN